ncbi:MULTISPECIES: OmpP1/FadL family transporter [Chryseobacterium]|uniref:OmpP1/FadL family transporter n=1 Tax=Chryseobacterium TaxID=59732 RepID=UPI000D70B3DC|nr:MULTISPECIES: outer membrane protein transport protein [Chryseobacterium]MCC3214006.1 outer membrane protein transport protein [Chryseobacterium sp. X308]PWW28731.1 long-chain fatty acid transport protein [Chryseobacterium sp. AG844]QRA43971.1 outer membrane protein transport protein [Chryseobacterium cucumeris]
MKKILVSTALLAGVLSYAGGFRVSLQGVKQLAMAHTSAHAEDASVTFFNPAGMSFIPSKLSVVAGGFGASNKVTFQNFNTLQSAETDNPIGTPIYAAITYRPIEKLTVGFSFSTPFGSTIKWPDNWEGKELVQKMELKSFYFQPMVSVKLAPWVSFGASYIYARGKVDWDKAVTQFDGKVNINDDNATGHGYGFGFYFRPDPKLDVSIAYRSAIDMKAKSGTATFQFPSQSVYNQLKLNAAGQDGFSATLPLVEEYTIGLTYKITPKWQVSADFNYHGWERYSKLTLDFENAPIGNNPSDPTILTNPKNFKNSKTFRLGTQYAFTNMIYGRLGAYYDEAPYTTDNFIPETPSYDTYVVTGGVGFKLKQFGIDVAGGYAMPQYRKVNNVNIGLNGQSKATAFYFGLGFSYNPF